MTARAAVRLLAIAMLGGILICASTALAQDKDKVRRAKVHYKQGKDFYDAKAYDLAIEEYKKAYDLMPLPELRLEEGPTLRGRRSRISDPPRTVLRFTARRTLAITRGIHSGAL